MKAASQPDGFSISSICYSPQVAVKIVKKNFRPVVSFLFCWINCHLVTENKIIHSHQQKLSVFAMQYRVYHPPNSEWGYEEKQEHIIPDESILLLDKLIFNSLSQMDKLEYWENINTS